MGGRWQQVVVHTENWAAAGGKFAGANSNRRRFKRSAESAWNSPKPSTAGKKRQREGEREMLLVLEQETSMVWFKKKRHSQTRRRRDKTISFRAFRRQCPLGSKSQKPGDASSAKESEASTSFM